MAKGKKRFLVWFKDASGLLARQYVLAADSEEARKAIRGQHGDEVQTLRCYRVIREECGADQLFEVIYVDEEGLEEFVFVRAADAKHAVKLVREDAGKMWEPECRPVEDMSLF